MRARITILVNSWPARARPPSAANPTGPLGRVLKIERGSLGPPVHRFRPFYRRYRKSPRGPFRSLRAQRRSRPEPGAHSGAPCFEAPSIAEARSLSHPAPRAALGGLVLKALIA